MMTAIDHLPTTNTMPTAENTNNMKGLHQLQHNVRHFSEQLVVAPKSTSSSSSSSSSSHLLSPVSMHGDENSMISFNSKMLTKNPRNHSDPPGRRGSQHPFYNAFDDNCHENHNNNNNDDSMSYDTTIYDDDDDDDNDINDDDEFSGSTGSSTPTPSSSTQNKRVRFGNITTYEVPSQLNEYMKSIESDSTNCCNNNTSLRDTSQLWYSSSDMITTRKDGRHLCLTDSNVKQYLYYYEILYRKLIMSHSRGDDIDEMEMLSTFDQMNLTRGLYNGYQGIEREGNFEQIRQSERRQIVRMIVELHKSMRQVQLNDTDENIKSNELLFQQQQLHTYAASLTKKMSCWARYIGQVAYVASQE